MSRKTSALIDLARDVNLHRPGVSTLSLYVSGEFRGDVQVTSAELHRASETEPVRIVFRRKDVRVITLVSAAGWHHSTTDEVA